MKIGQYNNLVFFDTETTGIDAANNRVIELAAIKVVLDPDVTYTVQMDEFVRLPEGEKIPEKIVELTHITDEMLAESGKDEETVLQKFYELIKDSNTLIIAHNAQFDLCFVAYAMIRYMKEHPEWLKAFNAADYLDSLTIFKDRRPYPHKLENAISEYHLEGKVQNSHRAVDDCMALQAVLGAIQTERNDLDKYINLFGYNPKYGRTGGEFKKVTYWPQPYRKDMASENEILPCYALKKGTVVPLP